jgi:hypothetical protein
MVRESRTDSQGGRDRVAIVCLSCVNLALSRILCPDILNMPAVEKLRASIQLQNKQEAAGAWRNRDLKTKVSLGAGCRQTLSRTANY